MKGDPMKIHIKADVKIIPLNICTPRKTPIAYLEAAKAKIDSNLEMGIFEKVDGVSRWCSPMSFVPKPNGKVRSVVDLVQLNKFVDRPNIRFLPQRTSLPEYPRVQNVSRYLTPRTATGKSLWKKNLNRTRAS
jgi:hypothetical protein